MVRELKTNTAVIVQVGPFFDKTDGVTLEPSLTITNEKVTLIAETDDGNAPTLILDNITGATSGTDNDLNYITNSDNAMMQIELSAANVNRLGRIRLTITDAANHVPVWEDFEVVSAQYYDAKYGTGNFSADVIAISTDATAANNAESFFDGTGYAGTNNVIPTVTASGLSAAAIDAVWDEPVAGHATASSYGKYLDSDISADAATAAAVTAASIADAVWDEAKSGHTGATTFGDLATDLDTAVTDIAAVHTHAGTIETDVGAIHTHVNDIHDTDLPAVKTDTGSIKTQTDKLAFTVTNKVDSNVYTWNGTAVTSPAVAGSPVVTLGATQAAYAPATSTELAAIDTLIDTIDTVVDDIHTDIGDIPTAIENADALLTRDWTSVTGEAARSVLNALRFIRNKWTLIGGTLSVKKENDSTEAWNATVTSDANAEPIIGNDQPKKQYRRNEIWQLL